MTAQRFRQIRNLYEAALEKDSASRVSFLEEACRGDNELYTDVGRLLTAHERTGGFMAQPIFAALPDLDPESIPRMEGRSIGTYKILREIGRGGMGAVYLASRIDDLFPRQLAIKVLRDSTSGAGVVSRFRQERKILASLEHPNIARLIDGGSTEEGLPYFVMEYVEGQPIDSFCNERKLSVSDRLRLFRSVCAAVQYAHQNMVVHRDLKPRNILVTRDGTVKLLDFGIAKLLSADDGQAPDALTETQTGLRLMTPEYASPEQVKGAPVTTSSDTYSLGVVLYELLTGRRPYRMQSRLLHEVVRVICEEEPTRPSTAIRQATTQPNPGGVPDSSLPERAGEVRERTAGKLKRRLQGDLDNILLKSLRKEPQRRYTSAEQLSEDLRRHLEGLPVSAQKDTLWYRGGKFLRRNRIPLTAVAAVLISISAGVISIRWQAGKARQYEIPAKVYTGHQRWLEESVRREPENAEARAALAAQYLQTGFLLEETRGDYKGALQSHRKAVQIAQQLVALEPDNPVRTSLLAWSLTQAGRMSERVADVPGATAHYAQALAILKRGLEAHPNDGNLREVIIGLRIGMARIAEKSGDQHQALDQLRNALAVSEGLEWTQLGHDSVAAFRLSGWLWILGLQFESFASDAKLPGPTRMDLWQQAAKSFERSLQLFDIIKKPLPPLLDMEGIQEEFYRQLPQKIARSKQQSQRSGR